MLGGLTDQRILALEYDARHVRMVLATTRRQKVRIDKVLNVSVPPQVDVTDATQVGAMIRQILDRQEITARSVVLDVPRDQAVLNTLHLPATDPDDLPNMVAFQITKELPFPIGEAVVDYCHAATPPTADAMLEVLVAAVRHEVLDFYRDVCQHAGLRLERVGLRPHANSVAVNRLLGEPVPGRVLFIEVGPTLTEIDVLHEGRLVFSRAASVAVPDGTEAAPPAARLPQRAMADEGPESEAAAHPTHTNIKTAVQTLLVEVTRSIEAYRARDPGAEMDSIMVAGSCGLEEMLAEALQARFDVSTETYNPAICFGWPTERGADAAGFAAVFGLVCGHSQPAAQRFNFLQPKKAVPPATARLRKLPVAAAVVLIFVLAGAVVWAKAVAPQRRTLAELNERINDVKREIRQVERYCALVQSVDDFERQQVIWLDELWACVGLMAPQERMVLTRVEMYQKGRRITLKFQSKDGDAGTELVSALEAYRPAGVERPYYKVRLGPLKKSTRGAYPYNGQIEVTLLEGVERSGA